MGINRDGENKSWINLPQDLIATIHNKLNFVDQIHFRAVCKTWRISEDAIKCSHHLPWLMGHSTTTNSGEPPFVCELFYPYSKQVLRISNSTSKLKKLISSSIRAIVYASKRGWTLFGCNLKSFFLHNPFTNELITLPRFKYPAAVATFSTNVDEFFVLCRDSKPERGLFIASFCLSRGDKEWSKHNITSAWSDCECYCVLYMKGKLYILFEGGVLQSYDLGAKSLELLTSNSHLTIDRTEYRCWLNEMEGDLIMLSGPRKIEGSHEWKIFRFDWSEMSWIVETSLKNTAFFINGQVSFSVPLGEKDTQDCRVFFHQDNRGVYSRYGLTKCYSFVEKRLIESHEYGWMSEPDCMMTFVEPPYPIRN